MRAGKVYRMLKTVVRKKNPLCGQCSGGVVVLWVRYQSGGARVRFQLYKIRAAVSPYNARPASSAARERGKTVDGVSSVSNVEYRISSVEY